MIPKFFNIKGYNQSDAYDLIDSKKLGTGIFIGITFLCVALFYHLVENTFQLLTFRGPCSKWIFLVIFTLVYSLLAKPLRKSTSFFFVLLILIPLFLGDLYYEGSFKKGAALWAYTKGSFLSNIPALPLKFLVWNTIIGFFLGPLTLWINRLFALLFVKKTAKKPIGPPKGRHLFQEKWTADPIPSINRNVAFHFLKWVGIVYLFYLIFLWIGWFSTGGVNQNIWPKGIQKLIDATYKNPIHGLNFMGKMVMMSLLGLIGAYNKPFRWYCTLALLVGHLISTGLIAIFYFSDLEVVDRDMLPAAGILDLVLSIGFYFTLIKSKIPETATFYNIKGLPTAYSMIYYITVRFLWFLTILFAFGFCFLLFIRFVNLKWEWVVYCQKLLKAPDFIAYNSMTYIGTLTLLTYLATRSEKLQSSLFSIIVNPLSYSMLFGLIWLAGGPTIKEECHLYFLFFFLIQALIVGLFHLLRKLRFNTEYLITSLHPSEAKAAESVIQSLYGSQQLDSRGAVKNIDQYISNIQGRKRGVINFPFWILENLISPIMGLRPAFSLMDKAERTYFLKKYCLRLPADRKVAFIPALAELAFKIGTSIKALATFGHFITPTGKANAGFISPINRPRFHGINHDAPNVTARRPPNPAPDNYFSIEQSYERTRQATTNNGHSSRQFKDNYDYIIIGSGAAGGVMAYRLAKAVDDPSKILLVERGKRQSPSETMTDDELQMLAKLYKEGGLQQTKTFDMTILQGQCLGGSTVINNAVCFRPLASIKKRWTEEFGLNLTGLEEALDLVKREINIHQLEDRAVNQEVLCFFEKGVDKFNELPDVQKLDKIGVVEVNAIDELGDGLWNLGNKRQRKLSTAQTYIKWAEALGIHIMDGTNALRFYQAENANPTEKIKADYLLVQDNQKNHRTITINKKLIVAGGCLASSHFLMRSKAIGKDVLKKGVKLACNYAFPLAFEYDSEINAFDGTQITAAAIQTDHTTGKNLVFETYFNPPGAFALTLPFHFQNVEEIMKNYKNYLNFGILIGSENTGTILSKPSALDGRAFTWDVAAGDIEAIRTAFISVVKIAHCSGAKTAILPLNPGLKIDLTAPNAVEEFDNLMKAYPLSKADININSSHPQGGNLMAGAVKKGERIVDENFKVVNHKNVYVIDASIFPTSVGVNPQWTIMGMSSLASKQILED